ncbi:MAG: hypothetical protein IPN29_12020 [Saprospiraceae bacterium]|nr:hypothetical protein [Saprospiraceae bacterium]
MGCFSEDREYIVRKLNLAFDVPAGLNSIESHYFRIDDVYMFLDETLEINKLAKESVTEITGSSAILTSRQGGVDFSDIDRISVFAVSQTDKSLRKEMFYLENIPTRNLNELKLLTGLSNISSLIVENKLDIEVRIQFRTFSTQPMRLDLDFGYLIFKN